jgi:hypothetical protein
MIYLTINLEEKDPRPRNGSGGRGTLCSLKATEKILDLLKEHQVKATFFVSGFFAEKVPELTKRISEEGHEIGCQGYNPSYDNMDKKTIKEDMQKAKQIIEELIGNKIMGFRAPKMKYVPEVVENVFDLGFAYDSSLISAKVSDDYNHKLAPLKPFHPLRSGPFLEIPVSGSLRLRLPFTSSMMRTFGAGWMIKACRKLLKDDLTPVISIHAWDLFPNTNKDLSSHLNNTGEKFADMLKKILFEFQGEFKMLKELIPKEEIIKKKEEVVKI